MRGQWLVSVCLTGILVVAIPSVHADVGDPFPPAGEDTFPSVFAHGSLEVVANPFGMPVGFLPDVNFGGPTTITRGDPVLGPGGFYQIPTEIISMNLTGSFGFVDATIRESSTRDSVGLVREITASADPGHFKADSFFDVFFEIDIQGGPTLFNRDAAYMAVDGIANLPPIGGKYELKGWIDEGSALMGDFVDLSGGTPAGFHPLPSVGDALRLYAVNPFTGLEEVVALLHGTDGASHAPVPAPGAALLGMLGLGVVGMVRRRFS